MPLPTDFTEQDEMMAAVDHRYRTWQTEAAEKIVSQLRDGTLQRCAEVGARVGHTSEDSAMASQIVGILMTFSDPDRNA